jgi:anti-anti-sigma factor
MNFGSTLLEIQGSSAIVRPEAGSAEARAEGPDADDRDVVLRGGDETDDFIAALRAATEHSEVEVVVVDLQHVRQITSRAFGAIVDSTNRLLPRGGRVAVAGASARIQKVMDTLKLSKLIASFESTRAAIEARGSRPAE